MDLKTITNQPTVIFPNGIKRLHLLRSWATFMSYFCRAKRSFKPCANELDVVKQTREIMYSVISSGKFQSCYMIPREGTQPIFGYRQTAEGLKPWPCLGQKNPKIHILLRTTCTHNFITMIRIKNKIHVVLFKSHLSVVNSRNFVLKSLLFYTWSTNRFHIVNQINHAGNILFSIRTDSHEIRQKTKAIPFPAEHPRKGHIREYTPRALPRPILDRGLPKTLSTEVKSRK